MKSMSTGRQTRSQCKSTGVPFVRPVFPGRLPRSDHLDPGHSGRDLEGPPKSPTVTPIQALAELSTASRGIQIAALDWSIQPFEYLPAAS